MMELAPALHRFNPAHFGSVDELQATAHRRSVDTLLIACSDHIRAQEDVAFAGAERFFILQHMAAAIPRPVGPTRHSVLANVEYAVQRYDVRHIVVCGHFGCTVIPQWISVSDSDVADGPQTEFQSTTVRAVAETYPDSWGPEFMERLICEHSLYQLENLQQHAFVRERLEAGLLKMHLWVVDDETSCVQVFDPASGMLVATDV